MISCPEFVINYLRNINKDKKYLYLICSCNFSFIDDK